MQKTTFLRRPFKYCYFNATLYVILINILIFLITIAFPNLKYYLSLNAGLVVYRKMFWQFLTYMYVHHGISHLLFNMFGLFIFGTAIERALGSKEFLLFYTVCGVISGLFSFVVYFFTGSYRVMLAGASGAIYAVLFAYAVIFPKSRLFVFGLIPIRAPILVLIYAVIEFVEQFISTSNVAHMTHLFGFVGAWFYFLIRMGIHPIKIWKTSWKDSGE